MRSKLLVFLLAALGLAGCSGSDSPSEQSDAEVIEAWADTLRSGDEEGAAEFFALPSIAENGIRVEIETREDALAFNSALACGAVLEATDEVGGATTATFRLTDRPGGSCGAGVGETAQTEFVIEDGLIVEWIRMPETAPEPAGQSV